MKTIQEAGPGEIAAIKRRNIRTLAMGEISQADCDLINKHLDIINGVLQNIRKRED